MRQIVKKSSDGILIKKQMRQIAKNEKAKKHRSEKDCRADCDNIDQIVDMDKIVDEMLAPAFANLANPDYPRY